MGHKSPVFIREEINKMSNENQDLLDLCRLNIMEDNVKNSPSPDRDITMNAIDRKKRELMVKIKPAIIPEAHAKNI